MTQHGSVRHYRDLMSTPHDLGSMSLRSLRCQFYIHVSGRKSLDLPVYRETQGPVRPEEIPISTLTDLESMSRWLPYSRRSDKVLVSTHTDGDPWTYVSWRESNVDSSRFRLNVLVKSQLSTLVLTVWTVVSTFSRTEGDRRNHLPRQTSRFRFVLTPVKVSPLP